jgi:hypothetical protein
MLQKRNGPRFEDLIHELDRELEMAILRLLGSREVGATISLREAALAVGGESWRVLLERTRSVASRLAEQGIVEFAELPTGRVVVPGSARLRVKKQRPRPFETQSRLN